MKLVLAIANILAGAGSLLWPIAFYVSIFSFDAPGSTENEATVLFVFALWTYPIPALIGNVLFWWNADRHRDKTLLAYTVISCSGYLTVAGSLIYLELFCDGKFACD